MDPKILLRKGYEAAAPWPWEPYDDKGVRVAKFYGVWGLHIDGFNWMNTHPADFLDHSSLLTEASGDVLLTGLGLGLGILFCEGNAEVESITVVEKDIRVIEAILPMINSRITKDFALLVADADELDYSSLPTKNGFAFDFAFIDHAAVEPRQETIDAIDAVSRETRVWYREHMRIKDNKWL